MKSIAFVKSIEEEQIADISQEHKSIVRERVQKYGNDAKNYLEWDEVENKINVN